MLTLLDAIVARKKGHYDCPAHQSRSGKSVRVSIAGDGRVLLHDHGGCSTPAILAALGLTWQTLFPERVNDPIRRLQLQHEQEVREGFHRWRAAELVECAQELRWRDRLKLFTGGCLAKGTITEEQAWKLLEPIFDGYSELEHRFETLRTGTDAETLEIYRHG